MPHRAPLLAVLAACVALTGTGAVPDPTVWLIEVDGK